MDEIKKEILKTVGHQVRIRACGICIIENQVLLVRHAGLGRHGTFWAPPGGGVHFGESAAEAVVREFWEETGLEVRVQRFLFAHEYLEPSLHAVELFFEVNIESGELQMGLDPEMHHQSIQEVRFLDFGQIRRMDPDLVHGIFRHCRDVQELLTLQGYFLQRNR